MEEDRSMERIFRSLRTMLKDWKKDKEMAKNPRIFSDKAAKESAVEFQKSEK